MENPQISIIIPTYNRQATLTETLLSVQNQTYPHWECIIVDDGSTDATKDAVLTFCEKDARFKYAVNLHAKGAPGARNTGMEGARGNYLIFLDSDDLLAEHCLAQRMEVANKYPGLDFYCFPTAMFHKIPCDSPIVWNYLHKLKHDLIRFFDQDMPWHTCGVLWQRSILKQLKGWDEALTSWQDWDLHVRALMVKDVTYHKAKDELSNIDSFYRRDESMESIANSYNSEKYLENTVFLLNKLKIPANIYKQPEIKLAYARLCFRVAMESTQFSDFATVRQFMRRNLRKVKYSHLYIFLWTGYLYNLIFNEKNRGIRKLYNQYPRFQEDRHLLQFETTHLKAQLSH